MVRVTVGTTFCECVEFVASKMKEATKPLSLGLATLVCFLFTNVRAYADYIYVSNSGNNTIEKFDSTGADLGVFTSSGLDNPNGVAFDSGGNLYVANYRSGRAGTIQKFDSNGNGTVFADYDSGETVDGFYWPGVWSPVGLAFDRNGNLYVANSSLGTIQEFDSTGKGSLFASNVYEPTGLAFDSSGNLYVANDFASYITKFSPSGQRSIFAYTFSSRPFGLAIDSEDNLYVGLQDSNIIEKFNPSGVGSVFASTGLNFPDGLAFDSNGNLYAANIGNSTIVKFDSNGTPTVFANAGLAGPVFLAFQVPEPATWAMVALGAAALLGGLRLRRWSS